MIDLIFVALLQAAAGDPAQPAETPPQTSEAPATDPAATEQTNSGEEQVRCRREPIVGTRLSRRICRTAAEERAEAESARDMVNRAQSQSPARAN